MFKSLTSKPSGHLLSLMVLDQVSTLSSFGQVIHKLHNVKWINILTVYVSSLGLRDYSPFLALHTGKYNSTAQAMQF